MLDGAIKALFGEAFSGLYLDGTLHGGDMQPTYDAGGNITAYTGATDTPIKYQRDAASWSMKNGDGYIEGDFMLIILAGNFTITTDHEVTGDARWKIMSCALDAAGSHWIARARCA